MAKALSMGTVEELVALGRGLSQAIPGTASPHRNRPRAGASTAAAYLSRLFGGSFRSSGQREEKGTEPPLHRWRTVQERRELRRETSSYPEMQQSVFLQPYLGPVRDSQVRPQYLDAAAVLTFMLSLFCRHRDRGFWITYPTRTTCRNSNSTEAANDLSPHPEDHPRIKVNAGMSLLRRHT